MIITAISLFAMIDISEAGNCLMDKDYEAAYMIL